MEITSLSPYEWCRKYAAGEIGRHELIDVLGSYPYTPMIKHPAWDDAVLQPADSLFHVIRAQHDGLIDRATYGEIIERIKLVRS